MKTHVHLVNKYEIYTKLIKQDISICYILIKMEVFNNIYNNNKSNNRNSTFYGINRNATCAQPIALVKHLVVGNTLAKFHYNSAQAFKRIKESKIILPHIKYSVRNTPCFRGFKTWRCFKASKICRMEINSVRLITNC